jgi:hypothetical protein
MKRKSLIEAVSPEARDFIEAGTPKPQFVQTQPEKAEGKTSPALVPEPPKAAIDPAEKKEISHCGLSILNGVGEPTMPSEHSPLCSVRSCGRNIMNRICLLLFALILPELPAFAAEKIDNRDFAIDTCYPTQNEIALAEARASRFWAKHSSRFGAEPRFLAVETSKIFPGEVQDLWPKLINSETTASYFSHGIESNTYSNLQLHA